MMSMFGKWVWASDKMASVVCGMNQRNRRGGGNMHRYMADNGRIYKGLDLTAEPANLTNSHSDLWTPGQVIGEFDTLMPKPEMYLHRDLDYNGLADDTWAFRDCSLILALAYTIWERTGVCFKYEDSRAIRLTSNISLRLPHNGTVDAIRTLSGMSTRFQEELSNPSCVDGLVKFVEETRDCILDCTLVRRDPDVVPRTLRGPCERGQQGVLV